jgi:hypothetical protein
MVYIKYSGTISGQESINQLVEEFVDICRISGWEYEVVRENFQSMTSRPDFPEADKLLFSDSDGVEGMQTLSSSEVYLEGIMIKPDPERDPIRFTFDRSGRMSTIAFSTSDTSAFTKKITVKKYEFLYFPYVKMVTRDYDHHVQVVKLLDYVKKRYVKDLEVVDNSSYWETRDEEQLHVKFWKVMNSRNLIV